MAKVAALAPDEVERRTTAGLAEIAAAASFDALKAPEVAHRGRQAPLTLAGAEIGRGYSLTWFWMGSFGRWTDLRLCLPGLRQAAGARRRRAVAGPQPMLPVT